MSSEVLKPPTPSRSTGEVVLNITIEGMDPEESRKVLAELFEGGHPDAQMSGLARVVRHGTRGSRVVEGGRGESPRGQLRVSRQTIAAILEGLFGEAEVQAA